MTINLLDSNFDFPDIKFYLPSKVGIHDIDLITTIGQSVYLILLIWFMTFMFFASLELNWVIDAKHSDNLFTNISHWYRSC